MWLQVRKRQLTHASLVEQVDELGARLEGGAHAPKAQALHVAQVGGLRRTGCRHVQHARVGQAALNLDYSLHTAPAGVKDFCGPVTGTIRIYRICSRCSIDSLRERVLRRNDGLLMLPGRCAAFGCNLLDAVHT